MAVETKTISYDEYLAMPETNQPCEVIDGEMIMSPAPTTEHQWIIGNILDALRAFVKKRKLGVVLVSPVDVIIRRAPLRTRQPDILYLSAERSGIKGRAELRALPVLEIAPDLAVEVLSPSDTRRAITGKLRDYQIIGVRECWLVSPEAETVEVLRLSSAAATTVKIFGLNDTLRSEVLPTFKLKLKDIFS
jgi:Uma2 family endonuclease